MSAYSFSDTTKNNKNKKWYEAVSIARSVREISVQVVEEGERLRRNRPAKEMSFKFFLEDRWRLEKIEKLMENNCMRSDEDRQGEISRRRAVTFWRLMALIIMIISREKRRLRRV